MDERVVKYLIRRTQHDEDERRSRRDHRDMRERDDYEDGRRGRRDYEDRRDRHEPWDYEDARRNRDNEDMRDYGEEETLNLSKADIRKWKKMLKNFDGSTGEHYTLDQILPVAHKMGVRFDEYDEKEFCIMVNVMYADYGGVLNKYVPPEKELHVCVELAKAFLEDVDGPEPAEKLALYFHCVVCAKV